MTADSSRWEVMQERLADREAEHRPHVSWQWYVDGVQQPETDLPVAIQQARSGHGFIWCGMRDPDDETMATFQELFGLHELAVEDAVEGHSRSKLECFDNTLFMVVSTVDYMQHSMVTEAAEIVSTGQIMVFLGSWFVMTTRRKGRPIMNQIRAELESDPEELAMGSWRVLYRILDHVIDDFSETIHELEADVDEVEDRVFAPDGASDINLPYHLKRELIEFKRCVQPLGAPLTSLQTRAFTPIPAEARAYFREVADHWTAVRESISSMDEVLGTILQAAMTRASVADGQLTRKLSAWLALVAVPTTFGAVYGMNFDNMPELRLPYGYYALLGVMAVIMIGLFAMFRRRRWL